MTYHTLAYGTWLDSLSKTLGTNLVDYRLGFPRRYLKGRPYPTNSSLLFGLS
jgi:hypothetical protein